MNLRMSNTQQEITNIQFYEVLTIMGKVGYWIFLVGCWLFKKSKKNGVNVQTLTPLSILK